MADDFAAKYEALRQSFRAQLAERLTEMERLADAGPDGLAELRAIAHRLAGQGGTFGAPEISRAASAVEEAPLETVRDALAALARVAA